jgi:hypothetical protein
MRNIVFSVLMLRSVLSVALMVAAIASVQAAPSEIRPGQYVRDGDSGTLTIRRDEQNKLIFQIDTIGGNCHTCGVTGVIQGAIGHGDSWTSDGRDSMCNISFSAGRSAVVVSAITGEECRAYCGARAGFDGTYRIPPASCTVEGRKALRDRFQLLYRAHSFSQAASTLQTLMTKCGDFMHWIEIDQVRNDLALSQYHKGEFSQCLQTLNATLAAGVKDEEELKSGEGNVYLPPCDFDNYLNVAKSTWFNKALCTKAASRGR